MRRICKYCTSSVPNYSNGCRWCAENEHIVDDGYSCSSFHYIECCESCHYCRNDKCAKGYDVLYLDRCMCRDEYEERIDL